MINCLFTLFNKLAKVLVPDKVPNIASDLKEHVILGCTLHKTLN